MHLVQKPLQAGKPGELVGKLWRPHLLPIGHIDIDDANALNGRRNKSLLILSRSIRQGHHHVLERQARQNRHPVIRPLAGEDDLVAQLRQRFSRKQIVRHLRLLQTDHVRPVLL
jgi:hypothetical protein